MTGPSEAADPGPLRIHATALVWGEDGIVIRGPSGVGKTSLAAAMVNEGPRHGMFSRFVADDVVEIRAAGGRLVARPHRRTAGLVEYRGIGIRRVPYEPACVVRLLLDLAPPGQGPARLPDPDALAATVLGITLPRLTLRGDAPALDNVYRTHNFFAAFRAGS